MNGLAVVVAGLTAVLAGCVPSAGDPRPYPDGCRDFNLSDAVCALAIVRTAADLVDLPQVKSIDLLGDRCPGPYECSGPVGMTFIVRVRFTMPDGTTPEANFYCLPGDSELCPAGPT